MVAVGTVVMNRVNSPNYPNTVCGVVGQKNQFAPGVMSRAMNSRALPDVQAAASSVLRGERHPGVRKAKFFHQAGLTFPYRNMHYVLEAGGNAFYERR
jgi:spore germination cell wall hydrolase CwlJ-like protein